MRLYIDDDSVQRLMIILLRNEGHDVETPSDAKLSGRPDAVHLTYAAKADRVLLSRNQDDFADLHILIDVTGGAHPGILIVCRENNPQRDMKPRRVVRALAKLIASGAPVTNQFTVLNHWR